MKIDKSIILELDIILKEEFNLELDKQYLSTLAYSLIGLVDLMQEVENRHKFGNSPVVPIENVLKKDLDKERKK